ncbi:pirin-like C-terminal cupin domain-containing protein [Nocardioides convexus]|uniref:pirin family protein n=1 Tax=Nocardioides convexus TaxID=2712224 RepID=UPI002418AC2C|nr:pirin-like C-terminal cupin domain-containing protein [Nocardioides convexus]
MPRLWVALPEAARDTAPGFEHYAPQEVAGEGWRAHVFLGSLLGDRSPVTTFTPLLGAETVLDPGTTLALPVEEAFEHGVLVDLGSVTVGDLDAHSADLAYVPTGAQEITLVAGEEGARLLVLGGPPFGESIVMWWNFVGRTHEEVVAYRAAWQEQITDPATGEVLDDSRLVAPGRFGVVPDQPLRPIPAPGLPNARLRERR